MGKLNAPSRYHPGCAQSSNALARDRQYVALKWTFCDGTAYATQRGAVALKGRWAQPQKFLAWRGETG